MNEIIMQYVRDYGTKALMSVLASVGGCLGGGCRIPLEGGGELSIGMRNDNFLVIRHTVDGEKVGKKSKAELHFDPFIEALFRGIDDEPEEFVIGPLTGE